MKDVIRTQPEGIDFINRASALFDGKPYHIEIRPFKRPKTAEQRAKFHVLVREFAIKLRDEHGVQTDPDELKDWFKAMYAPAKHIDLGPLGKRTIPISSEDWNIEQASGMIDHVYRVAAEKEIYLD